MFGGAAGPAPSLSLLPCPRAPSQPPVLGPDSCCSSLSPPGCPGLRVARPCHPQSPGMGVRDVPSPPPRRGLLRGRLGLVHPSFVMGLMYGAGVVPRSVTEGLTWGGSWTCRGCPGRGSDPPHGCLSSPSKVTGAPQTLRGALTLQTIWIQMREDLF